MDAKLAKPKKIDGPLNKRKVNRVDTEDIIKQNMDTRKKRDGGV